jgi:hypothetical protein
MCRSFALLLSFYLSACASLPRLATPDSVALINGTTGTCTAWCAAPRVWVTAKHCLTADAGPWTLAGSTLNVLVIGEDVDVALFTGPLGAPLPLADNPPPVGAQVLTFGYGMGREPLLTFAALYAHPHSDFFDNDRGLALLTGNNGLPGLSGAPVMYKGRVVGQISGGGQPTHYTHLIGTAVPLDALRAFIRRHIRP